MATKRNQQGFSLFMVMVMMIVIALLVVVTSQTTSTESRLSANEADRKYALTEAELGLRDAEDLLNYVYTELTSGTSASGASSSSGGVLMAFRPDCSGNVDSGTLTKAGKGGDRGGLCTAAEFPADEYDKVVRTEDKNRFVVEGSADKSVLERDDGGVFDDETKSLKSDNNKSTYVIEYLGQRENETGTSVLDYFRVTARAKGQNENTQVTLQSYVEMAREQ